MFTNPFGTNADAAKLLAAGAPAPGSAYLKTLRNQSEAGARAV